jgi:hypothetical protein
MVGHNTYKIWIKAGTNNLIKKKTVYWTVIENNVAVLSQIYLKLDDLSDDS